MAQVAARAGVSHQTVSRVLNDASLVKEETRLRVLAAIEELGYRRNFAARILATNRSRRIGMITAHLALHGPSMIALGVQEAGPRGGVRRRAGRAARVLAADCSTTPSTGSPTRPSRRSWWRSRTARPPT